MTSFPPHCRNDNVSNNSSVNFIWISQPFTSRFTPPTSQGHYLLMIDWLSDYHKQKQLYQANAPATWGDSAIFSELFYWHHSITAIYKYPKKGENLKYIWATAGKTICEQHNALN